MKKSVKVFILIFIMGSIQQSNAEESFLFLKDGQHLKKDTWDKERINVIDKTGNKTEYIKKDFLNKDRTNIYDENRKRTGYIKKDYFDKDRINIYDKSGKRKGYIKVELENIIDSFIGSKK